MSLKIPYTLQMVLFTRFLKMFSGYGFPFLPFSSSLSNSLSALVHQGFTPLKKSVSRWPMGLGGVLPVKYFQQKLACHFCFFCESPLYAFYDDH